MRRTQHILVFLFIAISLSACIKDGPGSTTKTTIINNSGHDIEMQTYFQGEFEQSRIIKNTKQLEFSISNSKADGVLPFLAPPFTADSIWIIYYEKASIWHTIDKNSLVSKNLMLAGSYVEGKINGGLAEYSYTFTPEDFEEALEFGD